MTRREFVTLLGGAAATWPLAARGQQPAMPLVGYVSVGSPIGHLLGVFKQSLAEAGFVEGRNVAIETPSADGHYDRLPALAADLVRRQVTVIVAITANPALAAKAATATIPIVFNVADDPVELGLVASLSRPGGNATGVSFLFSDLVAKHLGLLRELLPNAVRFGLLVNPQSANAENLTKNATVAAAAAGVEIIVVRASDPGAIEDAFATLVRQRADALMVGADGYFLRRRVQLTTLAARHGLPAVFTTREYAEAGELRHQPAGGVSDDGPLYRPHSQRCQACGPAGGAVDQVRFRHQRSDRPSARPRRARHTARPRRRGDRIGSGDVSSWDLKA